MKRFFVLFAIFLIPLVFPFFQASAQENLMRANANVEYNQQTYAQSTVIEILVSISCLVAGVDPVDPNAPCLGVDPVSRKLGYVPSQNGGLTGLFAGMIGGMYSLPISTHDYVAYNASRFGIAQDTYAADEGSGSVGNPDEGFRPGAQGVGFKALSPVIPVWVAFRNLVFIFFVIVFVLIGFGMMFRIQVGGAAMTIQSQLPKIVIVILLVVLSYPIAGFMIDMMYVLMYFMYGVFNSVPGVNLDPGIIQSRTPLDAVGITGGLGIAADASSSVGDIVSSVFDGTAGRVIAGLLAGIIGFLIAPGIGGIIGFGVGLLGGGGMLGQVGSIIAFVIFAVALCIALFRIWFELLKAFVSILIGAVMAPLWIASSLIPATPFPVTSWFRFMIGNLLMFPAAMAMFLFAFVFMQLYQDAPTGETIAFPFVGNPNDLGAFGALIGFGIILLIPTLIKKVKDAVGTPSSEVMSAVVGATGAGAAGAKAIVGKPLGRLFGYNSHGHPRVLHTKLMNGRLGEFRMGQGRMGKALSRTPLQRNIDMRGRGFGPTKDESGKDLTKGGFAVGRNIIGGVFPKPKKSDHSS